jgi:probable HAF family extracellular repeat protein
MVSRVVRTRHLSRFAPLLIGVFVLSSGDNVPTQSAPVPMHSVLEFGTLGGASTTFHDIHDFGTLLVGESRTASGATHAAMVRNGVLEDLGTLGGAASAAYGLYFGVVVGQAQTASGQTHAFRYNAYALPGTNPMADLGTLGGTFSAAYAGRAPT